MHHRVSSLWQTLLAHRPSQVGHKLKYVRAEEFFSKLTMIVVIVLRADNIRHNNVCQIILNRQVCIFQSQTLTKNQKLQPMWVQLTVYNPNKNLARKTWLKYKPSPVCFQFPNTIGPFDISPSGLNADILKKFQNFGLKVISFFRNTFDANHSWSRRDSYIVHVLILLLHRSP